MWIANLFNRTQGGIQELRILYVKKNRAKRFSDVSVACGES